MANSRVKAYAEIVRGYSEIPWDGRTVYLKHFTCFDQAKLDDFQETALEQAKAQLPTKEQKLQWLREHELWTKKDETDLMGQRDYLKNLQKTRSLLISRAQMTQMDGQIKDETTRLNAMTRKKDDLMGLTAEDHAARKTQFYQLHLGLFRDIQFKDHLLPARDDLDDEESLELIQQFIAAIEPFSRDNIRRISVSPYFFNAFALCGDDVTRFLGKPTVEFTLWQSALISSGMHFKSLFRDHPIPEDVADDPDKIDDYVTKARNIKEAAGRTQIKDGSTGLMLGGKEMEDAGLRVDRSAAMDVRPK